jgi:hypothetical protein
MGKIMLRLKNQKIMVFFMGDDGEIDTGKIIGIGFIHDVGELGADIADKILGVIETGGAVKPAGLLDGQGDGRPEPYERRIGRKTVAAHIGKTKHVLFVRQLDEIEKITREDGSVSALESYADSQTLLVEVLEYGADKALVLLPDSVGLIPQDIQDAEDCSRSSRHH